MGIGVPFVMPLTFSIDAATLGIKYAKERKNAQKIKVRHFPRMQNPSVSVIIPAYNAGKSIRDTVTSIYGQNITLKNVIVVDDCSTDETPQICKEMELEKDNFFHMRRDKNSGKARNINYVVQEHKYLLGDITLVIDSDIRLEESCIARLLDNFSADDVAAVTPYGYVLPPQNPMARALHYGNSWNNEVFKVRKEAQNYRNAISVICGAGTAYRTEVLRSLPIPTRTKTEDTDYTWLLQENGYKVQYDPSARIHSQDLEKPRSMLRQWYRWYSGTFQNMFVHGREMLKAKRMFWTTVLPSFVESVPYALGIVTLPLIFAANLAFPGALYPFGMTYVKGFFVADFLFTMIPTAIISPKYLRKIPEIYAYKLVGSALTLAAFFRTAYENVARMRFKWSNIWSKGGDFARETTVGRVTRDYMLENMQGFCALEDNWAGIGEMPWRQNNFMYELPKKWELSFAVSHKDKIIGYIIGSQAGENFAKVNKIVVDRKYRKKGIGKMLLDIFEAECLKSGITEVELKALLENRRANEFYLRRGYVRGGMALGTDAKLRRIYCKNLFGQGEAK